MKFMNNLTVLLGNNREDSNGTLKSLLRQKNAEVMECSNGIEVIRKSFEKKPDLIMLDTDLPLLNGYLCTKLLKSDPFMQSTYIVHISPTNSPIEQYWSRICHGDDCISKPVDEIKFDRIRLEVKERRHTKRRLLAPASILPEVDDLQILTLANNLLEQDLLRANILNEINEIDVHGILVNDIVVSLMSIIGSLFDFSLGTVMLLHDFNGEFYFYENTRSNRNRLAENKNLVLRYLKNRHDIHVSPKKISQTILRAPELKDSVKGTSSLYIHSKEEGPTRSVLAFENMAFDSFREDEQEILLHALNLVHGVLEKKLFYQMSQELSIIDTATEGYSMAFFMRVLSRELENAKRNRYPVTLFTIAVSDFPKITSTLSATEKHGLARIIHNLILKAMRKSDVVAKWDSAAFAFLLTHTPLEKARIAQKRIGMYIRKHLNKYLKSSDKAVLNLGISQYDPKKDMTPEAFFARSKPLKKQAEASFQQTESFEGIHSFP